MTEAKPNPIVPNILVKKLQRIPSFVVMELSKGRRSKCNKRKKQGKTGTYPFIRHL